MKGYQSVEYKELWGAGNPDIANTFFRAGLIESWGRGTLKIIQDCKEGGLPAPEFRYDLSGFLIEFRQKTERREFKSSGKSSGKILLLIKENGQMTIPEIAEKLSVSTRAIEKQLRNLQLDKRLERIGPAKGGYWKLIGTNENKQS